MPKTLGYMVTWTTYGTWLEGEEKGYVKRGQVLGGDKKLREQSKQNQKQATVRLTKRQRILARDAILEGATSTGENIFAIAVFSNHVHLVVGAGGLSVEKVVSRLKSAGYYALRKCGFEGRL